jgi:FAD/FMN-containing dehydrogenase
MKAKTVDGREVELTLDMINSLRTRIRGPMLTPDDIGYEESRAVWNAMIDRKPAVVVRCLGTADVIECVRFAREYDLLLCIKGGGHNIAGLAVADGALMLDMSLMRGVWVEPERQIVHAQAGCLLGDVDRETQIQGLAAVLGFISLTGIAGLTLGGGFGYLTRRWGWTADNLAGINIVTAGSQLVRASNNENTDLFWGLRGGGGNFGVVTGIDYILHPVGPEIVGGIVAWPAREASKVLELYRTQAEQAPPELTLVALMRPAPPVPWLSKDWHGKPIVALLACYTGSPDHGEQAVAPIKSFGNPIGDALMRRPYGQMQSLLDATQPKGRRCYWKSEYLPRIEPALCEKVIAHSAKIPSPHSVMLLFQIGGALNQFEEEYSPVGNRDARYVLILAGAGEQQSKDRVNMEWVRNAWNDMRQFSTGGTYINFLTEDEGYERIEAALGKKLQRLAAVKAKWDPENIFRTNRNILPA